MQDIMTHTEQKPQLYRQESVESNLSDFSQTLPQIDFYQQISLFLQQATNNVSQNDLFTQKTLKIPSIQITQYMQRINKFLVCSQELIYTSLVYMNRFFLKNPQYSLSYQNIHRMFFVSIMVAHKFLEDEFYTNQFYSQVSGIKQNDIFDLESYFLKQLNYDLYIDEDEFQQYKQKISQQTYLNQTILN